MKIQVITDLTGFSGLLLIHFFCQTFICRRFFLVIKVSTINADWIRAQTQGATVSATSRTTQLHVGPPLQCCAWWRREYWRPAHTSHCNTTQWQVTLHVHTLEQRFFNYSVTAPRVQIYSNILNLWDTSLNFSVHTGTISLRSRRRFFRAKGEISNTRARTREEKEGRPPLPFACFPRALQQLTEKTNRSLPRRLRENSLCNICYRVVLQRLVPQCVPVLIKMDSILLLQQLRVLLHTTLQKWTLMQHFVGGSFGRSGAAKVGPCVQALVK